MIDKALKLQIQTAIEHLKSAIEFVKADDKVSVRIKLAKASDCIEAATALDADEEKA